MPAFFEKQYRVFRPRAKPGSSAGAELQSSGTVHAYPWANAGSRTSGCKLQVTPSFFATNYANDSSGACAFRISHYSTNVRHCCIRCGNFNFGEGKADCFYMVMGYYRVFQGIFGWGISGEWVRLELDKVRRPVVVTGQFGASRAAVCMRRARIPRGVSILRCG